MHDRDFAYTEVPVWEVIRYDEKLVLFCALDTQLVDDGVGVCSDSSLVDYLASSDTYHSTLRIRHDQAHL